MALFLLLLLAPPPASSSCNDHKVPGCRAKVVEEYVVAAKLDGDANFPQLHHRSQLRDVYRKDGTKALPDPKDPPFPLPIQLTSHPAPKHAHHHLIDDFDDGNILQERDLLVHHHHLPPPPHPPPVPPPAQPPLALHYAPSLFALGLITFLMLLNSLQTSLLLVLKSKGSLLGSVTGALGRRKRFAVDVADYSKPEAPFASPTPPATQIHLLPSV